MSEVGGVVVEKEKEKKGVRNESREEGDVESKE